MNARTTGTAHSAATVRPGLRVRAYTAADESAVLALVNADRLVGQPEATPGMLAEALAGRSVIDGGWWAELEAPRTVVAVRPGGGDGDSGGGAVVGVVSFAVRPGDGAGFVLWLHGREDDRVLAVLVDHVLAEFGDRVVYAFEFASALTLGLEALPVAHRPVTRRVVEAAGFTGRDLWRYLHARLPITGLPHAAGYTVAETDDPPGKRLAVRDPATGGQLAEAVIGSPVAGVGVLWWISVEPAARRRGLGAGLLGSALDLLAGLGAGEVILYVDDDAPPGDPERDRSAANRMYDRAGLVEVDRLFSFTRTPGPGGEPQAPAGG